MRALRLGVRRQNVVAILNGILLVRAACVRCHETKCPLLTAFFSILLSEVVTFLPEGVIVGFRNFAWGLSHNKK